MYTSKVLYISISFWILDNYKSLSMYKNCISSGYMCFLLIPWFSRWAYLIKLGNEWIEFWSLTFAIQGTNGNVKDILGRHARVCTEILWFDFILKTSLAICTEVLPSTIYYVNVANSEN